MCGNNNVVVLGYTQASNRRFLDAAGIEHDTHAATLLVGRMWTHNAWMQMGIHTSAWPGKFLRNFARTCPALPCAIVTCQEHMWVIVICMPTSAVPCPRSLGMESPSSVS